jgi:hypothetical protein
VLSPVKEPVRDSCPQRTGKMRQWGALSIQENCVKENSEKAIFDAAHSNDFPEFLFSFLVKVRRVGEFNFIPFYYMCLLWQTVKN